MPRVVSVILATALLCALSRPLRGDSPRGYSHARSVKKSAESNSAESSANADPAAFFATLVQTHSQEHLILSAESPAQTRFNALLADRTTGATIALDPHLLGLLRSLAARHPRARIELVSGFRSPKLNEIMRKKGHHVASHSQHSLGHAVDFRLILSGASHALDPRDVEKELRELGWAGGTGTYLKETDWFVHADVGPKRHWRE